MKLCLFILFSISVSTATSAALPIECGVYTFYGYMREAPDGFLYISTNIETSSPFEIRVMGVPRSQRTSAFVGIQFYNPRAIETKVSNNSVVFLDWQFGDAHNLNNSGDELSKNRASYRWPKLKSPDSCDRELYYYEKKRSPK